ncbi:ADP-ribose pyrophosphatase [Gordonia hirsuta DSM 44140 = NBRC 16056]|uniref:ADP-ribose pyrophosphatase n=1 Tax=Gordonia hirsuta DSM 44140 = NBRC 16056 TaxID=1121927 RepID=L7L7M0_9ACTN|nr:NUDIX hydrolase [Gordonia hirsuta]GAC56003.1 ADP-ribose pyrophosphatase [Gordonia hirsuta DSM 44140 = NBRC 16056]
MSRRHEFAVTDSETVYSGAILALRKDQVLMPDGRTATREVVAKHGAVVIAARDADGRIALVLQYRHPVGRRLLELPAGLLDGGPDESPLQAAQRELAEEAGLAARRWSTLVDLVSSAGFCDEATRVFLAEDLWPVDTGVQVHEEADMTVHWMTLDEAVAATLSGQIVNASAVAGILALAAAERTGAQLRPTDAPWTDRPSSFGARSAPEQDAPSAAEPPEQD